MKRVVAIAAHIIPDRAPLQLNPGEVVTVGERDTEWPAFVFVTSASGSGWVPARHLATDEGLGTVRTPYDTTELPTRIGEILEVISEDIASGWLWCRTADGHEGWVPLRTVRSAGAGE